MNRSVSKRMITRRRQMDRVHTQWKSRVTTILEVAGFRPLYHSFGRHDVRVIRNAVFLEEEMSPRQWPRDLVYKIVFFH